MFKCLFLAILAIVFTGCVGAISKHNYKLDDIQKAERIYRGIGVVYGSTKAVIKQSRKDKNAAK
ncbi:hypothetical protein [Campylobacter sp. 19-13652]|uniref:hypothetical protein n=1 Tax=Campylobacter sp. 19-13652 TaxID=2840180 RepID=UPI001C769F76|nr:hypothetical protein [Campylobacter sp. 19-13652]BCX79293.1 hypothetical protein LBC_07550 [Campylobacter sp. 19-13652]